MAQKTNLCLGQLDLLARASASGYTGTISGCLRLATVPSRSRSIIESTSASGSLPEFWLLLLVVVLMALLLCSDGLTRSGEVVDGDARLLQGWGTVVLVGRGEKRAVHNKGDGKGEGK